MPVSDEALLKGTGKPEHVKLKEEELQSKLMRVIWKSKWDY